MKETWQVWSLLHRKYIELVEANMRQDVGREKLSHFVKTLEFMIYDVCGTQGVLALSNTNIFGGVNSANATYAPHTTVGAINCSHPCAYSAYSTLLCHSQCRVCVVGQGFLT